MGGSGNALEAPRRAHTLPRMHAPSRGSWRLPTGRARGLAAGLSLLAALGSCNSVGAKVWNLDQLHDAESRHRYHAALESDIEFFLRHELTGYLNFGEEGLLGKDAEKVEDPAQECLGYLVELEEAPVKTVRDLAWLVSWAARLATGDPGRLSRERATLLLGKAGHKLDAGLPQPLEAGQTPATPEAIAGAATALVRAARALLDPASLQGESAPTVDQACTALEALVLDLPGGRRALDAVGQLSALRGLDKDALARLERCARDLASRQVRLGLAAALHDPEPRVRAAAIDAAFQTAGDPVLTSLLMQLGRESAPLVLVRLLELVRSHGLPSPPPEVRPADQDAWRRRQLQAIYELMRRRRESEVQVAAMRALGRVSGAGFESLRQEDWQAWFRMQPVEAPQPAAPAPEASARDTGAPRAQRPASGPSVAREARATP